MLEEKIQQMPQVELSAFPPLKMTPVHTKAEYAAKARAGALEPARKQEQMNLQMLAKLIEHIEKNL
jgi:hypothetical protein